MTVVLQFLNFYWILSFYQCLSTSHHRESHLVLLESATHKGLKDYRKSVEDYRDYDNHTIIFAITQRNEIQLESILNEVSDPISQRYGKHLTHAEVGRLTADTNASERVKLYLQSFDVEIERETPYGEFIIAKAQIKTWEILFSTKFYKFIHVKDENFNTYRSENIYIHQDIAPNLQAVFNAVHLPSTRLIKPSISKMSRKSDSNTVTPSILNSHYNIFYNTLNKKGNQSVYSGYGYFFSQNDINSFRKYFNISSTTKIIDPSSRNQPNQCQPSAYYNCLETNLDLQYITAIAQDVPTALTYSGYIDYFINWIISIAENTKPYLVHSLSFSADESVHYTPPSLMRTFNTYAMKVGVMGGTILVSSGDYGANSFYCGYKPQYPAGSPYVTVVGATMGLESQSTEISCSTDTGGSITSGGGFSMFPAPSYQNDTIKKYFASLKKNQIPAAGFNLSGRGYPDVSLAGQNFEVNVGGQYFLIAGTSVSTPIFAGMVSLVNEARLAAGKPPVGWLNPTIYKFASRFTNDITSGNNKCYGDHCCSQGFYTTQGWDPVTGFGSVDFRRFYIVMMGLTDSPTSKPTSKPTRRPVVSTSKPTRRPVVSTAPSRGQVTVGMTAIPSSKPSSRKPTTSPTRSRNPTRAPTKFPTNRPSVVPSSPTKFPTNRPSVRPSVAPLSSTKFPTNRPTNRPSVRPSLAPLSPTKFPTMNPTIRPTCLKLEPRTNPTPSPSSVPSKVSTLWPSMKPASASTPRPAAAKSGRLS